MQHSKWKKNMLLFLGSTWRIKELPSRCCCASHSSIFIMLRRISYSPYCVVLLFVPNWKKRYLSTCQFVLSIDKARVLLTTAGAFILLQNELSFLLRAPTELRNQLLDKSCTQLAKLELLGEKTLLFAAMKWSSLTNLFVRSCVPPVSINHNKVVRDCHGHAKNKKSW